MTNGAGKAKSSLPADARRIPIPAVALGPWLAAIEDAEELRVTLRAVALLAERPNRRGIPPSVSPEELLDDPFLTPGRADASIRAGLAAALERGTLAAARDRGEVGIFLNDAHFRQYLDKMGLFALKPAGALGGYHHETAASGDGAVVGTAITRANIFALYEQHIGTFGASIAEQLRSAEEEYPAAWIEYAFAIASEHNARSWNYVNTILRRMVREGLPDRTVLENEHGKSGDDTEANRRAEFLEQYRRLFGELPWESEDRVS